MNILKISVLVIALSLGLVGGLYSMLESLTAYDNHECNLMILYALLFCVDMWIICAIMEKLGEIS